jgi:hypothetical protein
VALGVEPDDQPGAALQVDLDRVGGGTAALGVPSTSRAGAPPATSSRSVIGSEPDSTIGRLMPDCGAAGATMTASSAGETTGPPAA